MAHQAHNVPWNTLASHLKFIRDARHITPNRTDFFPLEKPNQANDLIHFTKPCCHHIELRTDGAQEVS
jgi:hypothetical protein